MPKINVHEIWLLKPVFDDETGEIVSEGLFHVLGPEGAIRELRRRCEAEVESVGKPLAGCSIYSQQILQWVKVCINNREPGIRRPSENLLIVAGERDFVDLVTEAWESSEQKGDEELPPNVKYDIIEYVRGTLEDRYGEIAYLPEHLTPTEIKKSKTIALSLGMRKPRKRRTPAPEEAPVEEEPVELEETAPEPEEEPAPAPPSADAVTEDAIKEAVRIRNQRAGP